MSNSRVLIIILIIALVTAFIRFLPFLIFGRKKTPAFIEYLSNVLPSAVMGMLAVYCLKDIRFDEYVNYVPYICGTIVTVVVHIWKKNPIYSILSGTILFMILIRVI